MRKKVEFYRTRMTGPEKVGEVVLFDDGTIEFSDKDLQRKLEITPIMVFGGRLLRPADGEKWFMALPQGFSGSYFFASDVLEDIVFYSDDDGNEVPKDKATRVRIVTTDDRGNRLETWGVFRR